MFTSGKVLWRSHLRGIWRIFLSFMANFTVLFSLSIDKNPQQRRWEDGDLRGIDCVASDRVADGDGWVSVAEEGTRWMYLSLAIEFMHMHMPWARPDSHNSSENQSEQNKTWFCQRRPGSHRLELVGMIIPSSARVWSSAGCGWIIFGPTKASIRVHRSHRSSCSKYFSSRLLSLCWDLLSQASTLAFQPNLLFFSKCSQTLISFLILKKRKPAFQSVMLYLESVWGICFWVILSFLRRSPHTCVLRGIFSWSSWSWAEVSRYPLHFKEALCGWKEPLVCAYCWITAAVYIVSTVSFAVSSDHFTITGWYGENVTLPCRYDAQAHGSLSFCWGQAKVPMSKCSRTIVSSVDGAVPVVQSPRHQLAGRVGDGDVSLTILNARWSDGGEYGCRVEIPGWFNDHKVDFQLVIADGETPEQGPG